MHNKRPKERSKANSHVSLADIAEVCGLSKMTVSRVLRDSDNVSVTTRQKVLDAARRMGYIPNRLAVSFSQQRTGMVAIVIPELDHSFFSSVMMSIERVLSTEGYLLSLCCSWDKVEKEFVEVRALLERRVDGIIIAPVSTRHSGEAISHIKATGCPFVLLDRIVPGVEADVVNVDDFEGALAAVTHLIEQGYENVAYIGGPEDTWVSEERLRGYRDALTAAGREVSSANIIRGEMTAASGEAGAEHLLALSDGPDAFFCANDAIAVGALSALKKHGILVPDTVGLVGFANMINAEVMSVPITTVAQDTDELGSESARILLARMAGEGPARPIHHLSRTRLIVRESSVRISRRQRPASHSVMKR